MHLYKILLICLVAFLFSGCLSQTPAPIEYGLSASPKNNNDSDSHDKEPKKEKKSLSVIAPPNKSGKETYHEVAKNENIDSIAQKYQVPKEELIKLNMLEKPYELEHMQLIMIPSKGSPQLKKKPVESKQAAKKGSLPVNGMIVSRFGQRYIGAINQGINIAALENSEILAIDAGTVIHSNHDPKFGNLIIIKSDNKDIFLAYGHMSKLQLKKGAKIAQNAVIGRVGTSGKVTKPQLHFAVRKGKIPINPETYLKQ